MASRLKPFSPLLALLLCAAAVLAQDTPSLGDLARQERQKKAAQNKDAKPPKVITNEEIPARAASEPVASSEGLKPADPAPAASNNAKDAAGLKSQIQTQKSQIASLEKQIGELSQSIQFAPANCAENCVQWNKQQQEKQQQVAQMQSMLEEQKKQLEDLQDSARKQGFGSSVYDP